MYHIVIMLHIGVFMVFDIIPLCSLTSVFSASEIVYLHMVDAAAPI